jgi:hypothetical protein
VLRRFRFGGRSVRLVAALGVVVTVLGSTLPALGGGNVLLSSETPRGYSLTRAAADTAVFNVGPRTANTLSSLPAAFKGDPFQFLYVPQGGVASAFSVKRGTMLYVPVTYSDDSDGLPFPDVNDPEAVADYWFSPDFMGAQSVAITVDGRVNELGRGYAVGTPAPGLPTGGNNYTVMAAFVSPMPKGTHTLTIAATFNGALFGGETVGFVLSYTVNAL